MPTERNPRQVLARHIRALEHRQKHLLERIADPDRREQSKAYDKAEVSALSMAINLMLREMEALPPSAQKDLSSAAR